MVQFIIIKAFLEDVNPLEGMEKYTIFHFFVKTMKWRKSGVGAGVGGGPSRLGGGGGGGVSRRGVAG